jgi:hypothetical protein
MVSVGVVLALLLHRSLLVGTLILLTMTIAAAPPFQQRSGQVRTLGAS